MCNSRILESQQHRPGGDGGGLVVIVFLLSLYGVLTVLAIQAGIHHGRKLAWAESQTEIAKLTAQVDELEALNHGLEQELMDSVAYEKASITMKRR